MADTTGKPVGAAALFAALALSAVILIATGRGGTHTGPPPDVGSAGSSICHGVAGSTVESGPATVAVPATSVELHPDGTATVSGWTATRTSAGTELQRHWSCTATYDSDTDQWTQTRSP